MSEISWWTAVVNFGPSFVFAFSSAEYVLRASGVCDDNGQILEHTNPHKNIRWVGSISLVISLAIYVAIAIGGSRAFGSSVHDDILKNFSLNATEYPIVSALVLATNALSLVLSFPVFTENLLLCMRELLHSLLTSAQFEKHVRGSTLVNKLINPAHPCLGCAWVLPLSTALAYSATATGLLDIINLMSPCTDYAFMFVFPGLVYCATFRLSPTWTLVSSLIVGACIMGSVSFLDAWSKMSEIH